MTVRTESIVWTREELILALNLYFEIGNAGPTHTRVEELALLYKRLGFSRDARGIVTVRSNNSIAMKLGNFRYLDPDQSGEGLSGATSTHLIHQRGGKVTGKEG